VVFFSLPVPKGDMMGALQIYSKEIVNEVLAATDIVDVIGASIELKPAGSGRFKALCPFHNEKTPSFSVNRDRQMYYCFGCGKGGDAISFLMEHEGLSFGEALRRLADKVGIRLPTQRGGNDTRDSQRQKLLEFNGFAQRFFVERLNDPLEGGIGRRYLAGRTLKPETVKTFALGYAPEGWSQLLDAARSAGYHDDLIEVSGLTRRSERGTLYDFFRNRLMFPIRGTQGDVVAFGGRDIGGDSPAKYINTPENPAYKKGETLYGLYEAREGMRREKSAILVEGYFDLIRCFDAGIDNVVASCGTALTAGQAKLIRRYVTEVVVVFDGDPAGIRAALRGISVLVSAGLGVRALILPQGQDPDDFVREQGAPAFRELVSSAADFVSFYIRSSGERMASIEGRTDVAREVLSTLLAVDDELRRNEYLKQIAKELHQNEWTVRSEFMKMARDEAGKAASAVPAPENAPETVNDEDAYFLAVLLKNDFLLQKVQQALAAVQLPPGPLSEVLVALWARSEGAAGVDFASEGANKLYAAAANMDEPGQDKGETLVLKRLARIRKESLESEARRVQEAILEAERAHDTARVVTLLNQKIGINQAIDQVGAT